SRSTSPQSSMSPCKDSNSTGAWNRAGPCAPSRAVPPSARNATRAATSDGPLDPGTGPATEGPTDGPMDGPVDGPMDGPMDVAREMGAAGEPASGVIGFDMAGGRCEVQVWWAGGSARRRESRVRPPSHGRSGTEARVRHVDFPSNAGARP